MAAPDNPTAPRRPATAWRALLVLALALAGPSVVAQVPGDAPTYPTNQPEIRIPFTRDTGGRVREVQLFVSTDQGRDWRYTASANPADGTFPVYVFPADGTYWFAVRAIDLQNQPVPAALSQLTPQMKVIVDRKPPAVMLRQTADPRPGTVTVEWDVRDENLDPRRFALEYRVPGNDWQREASATPKPVGTQSWTLPAGVRMDVRLRVADRAGNETAESITVGFAADGRPLDPAASGSSSGGGTIGQAGVHYSNSPRISIGYQIAKVPLSSISVFELWYTKDRGQHWAKVPRAGGAQAAGALPSAPGGAGTEATVGELIFEADGQGLYGFRIVSRNGVGIGTPDPVPGDQPAYQVIVDTEPPKVTLRAKGGPGYDVRNVRIEWQADDPNLADKPVSIEYAEVRGDAPPTEADWKKVEGLEAAQDYHGMFTWTVGRTGPFKFHIRAKAVDKAGNVGADQTRDPIVVDLEPPSINITNIKPASPSSGRLP